MSNPSEPRRRAVAVAALLAGLAGAVGCDAVRVEAVRVPLVFRDGATGRPLDDCLLVRCMRHFEGAEGLWEMADMRRRVSRVDLWRADSGFLLDQPEMTAVQYPLLLMRQFEGEYYEYLVMREGYAPALLTWQEVVWEGRNGTPKIVDLDRAGAAWAFGAGWADPVDVLKEVAAAAPAEHPLAGRLAKLARDALGGRGDR